MGPAFPSTCRYENLGQIGRGGTSIVFCAHDRDLGREVALKVLAETSVEAAAALKREFRSVSDLTHLNLARLYELDATGRTPFFTMERIRGVELGEWSRDDRSRLAPALVQLLSGLHALHRAGVVHRDVKPSNVLVTEEGRVVLLDFGFAISSAPMGALRIPARAVVGTPRYLAPEVFSGRLPGPAADLYAVGLLLYEALGGSLPNARDWSELIRWKRRPASAIAPLEGDATGLAELAWRLIDPDPARRPTLEEALLVLGTPTAGIAHSAVLDRPPLAGRARELARLEGAVEAVRHGTGRVIEVQGDSGLGKTRLVSELVRRLGERAIVLAGRCHPNERVAYRALDGVAGDLAEVLRTAARSGAPDLLASADPALFQLFPVLAPVRPEPPSEPAARRLGRAIGALRTLLAALATAETPGVLWIDDAQWIGDDAATLLRDLLAQPNDLCVLTILCSRSDTSACMPPALASVVDETLELRPLSDEQSREMLGALRLARSVVEQIVRESSGNATVLLELARSRASRRKGFLSFAAVLDERLAGLQPSARGLLDRLAVAGRPVLIGELAAEADRRALRQLQEAGLVRADGVDAERGYAPIYDRVRVHVLGALSEEDVVAHHRALTDGLLAMDGAAPELVVLHLRAAGDVARAYPFAVSAAEAAAGALAFAQSAALYRDALDLAPEAERPSRQRNLADALAQAGRGESAARHYLALVPDADDRESLLLEQRAAEQLLFSGHQREGVALIGSTLRRVGESLPRSRALAFAQLMLRAVRLEPGRVRCAVREPPIWSDDELRRVDVLHAAALGLSMSEAILSSALGLRHLDAAVRLGEPGRLARAIAIQLAQLAAFRYDPAKTRALGEQSLELAERAGSAESIALVRIASATAAWMEGRFEDCHTLATSIGVAVESETPGLRFHRDSAQIIRLAGLLHTGRWRELGALAPEILTDAVRRGDLYLEVNVRVRYGGWRWLARDDPSRGIAEIEEGARAWPRSAFDLTDLFAVHGAATCLLYDERPEEALARLDAAMPGARRSFLLSVGFLRTLVVHLRARVLLACALKRGEGPPLRALRSARKTLARVRSPLATACARALEAELAVLDGDLDAARDQLAQAATSFQALGMRLESAAARVRLSTLASDQRRSLELLDTIREAGVRRPWKLARVFFPTLAGLGASEAPL